MTEHGTKPDSEPVAAVVAGENDHNENKTMRRTQVEEFQDPSKTDIILELGAPNPKVCSNEFWLQRWTQGSTGINANQSFDFREHFLDRRELSFPVQSEVFQLVLSSL